MEIWRPRDGANPDRCTYRTGVLQISCTQQQDDWIVLWQELLSSYRIRNGRAFAKKGKSRRVRLAEQSRMCTSHASDDKGEADAQVRMISYRHQIVLPSLSPRKLIGFSEYCVVLASISTNY